MYFLTSFFECVYRFEINRRVNVKMIGESGNGGTVRADCVYDRKIAYKPRGIRTAIKGINGPFDFCSTMPLPREVAT